jgi:hypothetical protein
MTLHEIFDRMRELMANSIMNALCAFALLAFGSLVLIAQGPHGPTTNAEILAMTKSGLAEQTILLVIKQGSTNFDTSAQALIELKKSGVTDAVLNAMLSAPKVSGTSPHATSGYSDPSKLLDKALNATGPREKLTSIHTIRYVATLTQPGRAAGTTELERVSCYPDRVYATRRSPTGLISKLVLTPEFNYVVTGKMTSAIPTATLETLRTYLQFDPAPVAQHAGDFVLAYDGSEDIGTEKCDKLRIRNSEGKEMIWSIDQSGRIRRISGKWSWGEGVTDLSDYRLVDGVNVSFKRHVVENGKASDIVLSQYEINPLTNPAWFSPPATQPVVSLQIKVLQAQSVPYVQESGGGISTTCNIAGSANTSMTAIAGGNITLGNATTDLGLQMNCNSYDTTVRWPHVLNAMLVEASDGNAYIIACDRAWSWSKCVPLRAGEVFNAQHTSKGMAVQAFNNKGRESEPTYAILQSKSLH